MGAPPLVRRRCRLIARLLSAISFRRIPRSTAITPQWAATKPPGNRPYLLVKFPNEAVVVGEVSIAKLWVSIILVVSSGTTACDIFAYRLDLDVLNESAEGALIEIIDGAWDDIPAEPAILFDEIIAAGGMREIDAERPGPGTNGWTVIVNGEIATNSGDWPQDNPTIDLTIRIRADGSIVVEDT